MKTEGSVEIDRPIQDVFHWTIEHIAAWSMIVVETEGIRETPVGVGRKFRTVTEENGRRMEFSGIVTRHEVPHEHAIHMTGDMFDLDVEYRFEDLSGRTRVTQKSDVTGKGIFGMFLNLFGWMMMKSSCKALDRELNSLKRFCEQQVGGDAA